MSQIQELNKAVYFPGLRQQGPLSNSEAPGWVAGGKTSFVGEGGIVCKLSILTGPGGAEGGLRQASAVTLPSRRIFHRVGLWGENIVLEPEAQTLRLTCGGSCKNSGI